VPKRRAQCRCQAPQPRSGAPSGAGLDSGTAPAAQSAMPSIAARSRTDGRQPSTGATASGRLDPQSRISTSLTDVTDPLHYLALLERKIGALDQAAPLVGWDLPEEFATLRRLIEARMAKRGKREFVQVLRLLE